MNLSKLEILIKIAKIGYYPEMAAIPSEIIMAQALEETGRFTSNIFKENKNLFGMKKPSVRKNFVIGENRGHAVYSTYFNSIKDYFERAKAFRFNAEKEDYLAFLARTGYAENPRYIPNLKKHMAGIKTENPILNWVSLGTVFF